MSNQSTSIRHAITINTELPALVAEAGRLTVGYVGFYFDDSSESWDYWTSEMADATATNVYYTPAECRALLVERGFPELLSNAENIISALKTAAIALDLAGLVPGNDYWQQQCKAAARQARAALVESTGLPT